MPTTPSLTVDEVALLRRHVVSTTNGLLATEDGPARPKPERFATTREHIQTLVFQHIADYAAARKAKGLPARVMLHAHGGLVAAKPALGYAIATHQWWLDNGVYPVYFVWRSGILGTFRDVLAEALIGAGADQRGDFTDGIIEFFARFANGPRFWGEMKDDARESSRVVQVPRPGGFDQVDGGGLFFAKMLKSFRDENPDAPVELHAVGHSAGSIFHSEFIPAALGIGIPAFESLSLLAPAVRVDEFLSTLRQRVVDQEIRHLSMFTMAERLEKDDTCFEKYQKSLLYFIRGALEKDRQAEILGLQECIKRDPELRALFGTQPDVAQVIYSQTQSRTGRSATQAVHHSDFDNDRATMMSVGRRIMGLSDFDALPDFPRVVESRGLPEPLPSGSTSRGHKTKRALCIGINAYPGGDRLRGAVADARRWAEALTELGYEVQTLLDKEADKSGIMLSIGRLLTSSRPGDSLVIQYAGHGTEVEDFNGDEKFTKPGATMDSALCPVDFRKNGVIVDDELALAWDLLPEGVSLTLFFDSCYSGDGARNSRAPEATRAGVETAKNSERNVRFRALSKREADRVKAEHGPVVAASGPYRQPGVLFSACGVNEVAYEDNGAGVFTSMVVPLLKEAVASGMTNTEFLEAVRVAFAENGQQHPMLTPGVEFDSGRLREQRLLAGVAGSGGDGEAPVAGPVPTVERGRDRVAVVAEFLRATAAMIES